MFKQLVYNRLVLHKRLVILDAPLLFETALLEHFCYPTIVVACSVENELARLEKRDGLSREDAEKRIQSQMPLHVRCWMAQSRVLFAHAQRCVHEVVKLFDYLEVTDNRLPNSMTTTLSRKR